MLLLISCSSGHKGKRVEFPENPELSHLTFFDYFETWLNGCKIDQMKSLQSDYQQIVVKHPNLEDKLLNEIIKIENIKVAHPEDCLKSRDLQMQLKKKNALNMHARMILNKYKDKIYNDGFGDRQELNADCEDAERSVKTMQNQYAKNSVQFCERRFKIKNICKTYSSPQCN